MAFIKHDLPYFHDSALLFERIKHLHWPMFLDSGQMHAPKTNQPASQFGRYDILVANPFVTFVTQHNKTMVTRDGESSTVTDTPFDVLNAALKPYLNKTSSSDVPFSGGALGYFAYDLGRYLEQLPTTAVNDASMPDMMVGIYDWAIVVDHRLQKTSLVSHQFATSQQAWADLIDLLEQPIKQETSHFAVTSEMTSNLSQAAYTAAFEKIQDYIAAGDCYQVNLAQRFSAQVDGDSWQCYRQFRQLSPAPFMAYMALEDEKGGAVDVLSVSPERFLHLTDGEVETRPIKGTRPRFSDPEQDKASAQALVTSDKDRAENLMIVDLLRNDISKVCKSGSVKADQLFKLQSFANVHHLVSYVTGTLHTDYTPIDLLAHCFPGGSITGAPKLRAMEIIEELEPHRRGVYCGAIGYIGFDGDMDTSITIRTAVIKDEHIYFYAGGGIVADSEADKEYKETLDKASNFIALIRHFQNQ